MPTTSPLTVVPAGYPKETSAPSRRHRRCGQIGYSLLFRIRPGMLGRTRLSSCSCWSGLWTSAGRAQGRDVGSRMRFRWCRNDRHGRSPGPSRTRGRIAGRARPAARPGSKDRCSSHARSSRAGQGTRAVASRNVKVLVGGTLRTPMPTSHESARSSAGKFHRDAAARSQPSVVVNSQARQAAGGGIEKLVVWGNLPDDVRRLRSPRQAASRSRHDQR